MLFQFQLIRHVVQLHGIRKLLGHGLGKSKLSLDIRRDLFVCYPWLIIDLRPILAYFLLSFKTRLRLCDMASPKNHNQEEQQAKNACAFEPKEYTLNHCMLVPV